MPTSFHSVTKHPQHRNQGADLGKPASLLSMMAMVVSDCFLLLNWEKKQSKLNVNIQSCDALQALQWRGSRETLCMLD